MIPFLPPEILDGIFDHLKYISSLHYHPQEEIYTEELAKCCLTSKTFLSVARPRLYQSITVLLVTAEDYDWCGGQYVIEKRERRLLRTLRRNSHLREMVQEVKIAGSECGEWRMKPDEEEPEDGDNLYSKLIKPLIEELPNLKVVTISNLLAFSEVDKALCLAQEQRWKGREADHELLPTFNLDHGKQIYGPTAPSAVYHGYKCPDLSYNSAEWDITMESSHKVLRSVSVILDDSTCFDNFPHLERLTLELSGLRWYRNRGVGVDHILLQLLAKGSTPSLRVLVLRPYISPNELSNLLRNGTLAATLPPSLTHLSIFIPADPSDVLIFIRSLPNATRLERFNYRGEEGEAEEVKRACKERGIRLSLKQRWKIWW